MDAIPYKEVRRQIHHGDLLFCSGNGTFSELIKKFTGGSVSHVGMIFIWGPRLMVVESVETIGTRIIPLSTYVNGNGDEPPYDGKLYIARVKSPDYRPDDALSWGLDHVPYPYDNKEIARITARITGLSPFDAVVDNQAFICSEFVYCACKAGGVVHPYSDKGFIAPSDIFESEGVAALFEIGR